MNLPNELIDKILDYREQILWKKRFNNMKKDILFNAAMKRCDYYE